MRHFCLLAVVLLILFLMPKMKLRVSSFAMNQRRIFDGQCVSGNHLPSLAKVSPDNPKIVIPGNPPPTDDFSLPENFEPREGTTAVVRNINDVSNSSNTALSTCASVSVNAIETHEKVKAD
ncbi:putative protein phosphatase 2C 28 [Frankliniella fusca]|uniref:Uncharacterized protein n=1 Tax=Frankliniella fusca TaxID=407009 RepID=A0AAE1H9R2_9NEOP|nr:putative protein phosphatase 2C 28 [Frankliniella fusca]